jgi:agmatine/peptidylarginine deiminase
MKKIFFAFIFSIFLINILNAQDLPRYLTEEEKVLMKNYTPPASNPKDINPPPTPVRTIAEWEELQGILITWTSFTSILSQMVSYAQTEGLVFIVCTDSNSVKTYLTGQGVPLVNLRFLITSFNSIWCRDYGPWCVYSGVSDSLKFIDWIYNRPRPLDDVIPAFMANYLNIPLYQTTTAPNNLTCTGGNFIVDGNNTGFSSKLVQTDNPTLTQAQIDTIMRKYMGLKRYVVMTSLPYDGIHHIDMHMKLLDEETLLVGQYPIGVADGPQIELNLQYILTNYQTCYGRPYRVVRIPMPPQNGNYPPTGDYYTYTNSTFVNKTLIVPIYGVSQDTTALRIYRENLPGYKVVGINCTAIIPSLGAIHCINKEIGVLNPIFISHAFLRNTSNTTVPYEVKAYVKSKGGIASVKMFWTTDTLAGFTQVNMSQASDTFRAYIPNQPLETKVYYYITANSNNGRTVSKPLTAPVGFYKFLVTNTTGITANENKLYYYTLYQNYPNPFNPSTQISYYLEKKDFVSLKIFDVTGREIQKIVNGIQSEGIHTINFDGRNLPSGVYFYTIESNGWKDTKRMLMIK